MSAQKYLILSSPEQLFHTKREFSGFLPIIPASFNRDTIATFFAYFRRKEMPTALVFDQDYFSGAIENVDEIWVFSAYKALQLRKNGYGGKIRLFCGVRDLISADFFFSNDITPVVTTEAPLKQAQNIGLAPLYLSTDKSCIASPNRCLDNKGDVQNFMHCDNRCRIKSSDTQSQNFPLSIKPERHFPKDVAGLVFYSDSLIPTPPTSGEVLDIHLEHNWNYREKLGRDIIEKAVLLADGRWKFRSLKKAIFQRITSGQVQFWGYRKSLYDGGWIAPLAQTAQSSSLIVETDGKRDIRSLLLIERYSDFDEAFFKQAQHFLRTLPPKLAEDRVVEDDKKISQAQKARRITVVVDELGKELIFRAKQIRRVILRYKGTLPKGFAGQILLDKMPTQETFSFLENTQTISAVVASDVVLKHALQSRGFSKPIYLYPLALPVEKSPTLYATRSPLFFTDFITESKRNYRWPSLRMRMVRSAAAEKIEQFRFLQRQGDVNEIWVDISGSDDEAARRMKNLVDSL